MTSIESTAQDAPVQPAVTAAERMAFMRFAFPELDDAARTERLMGASPQQLAEMDKLVIEQLRGLKAQLEAEAVATVTRKRQEHEAEQAAELKHQQAFRDACEAEAAAAAAFCDATAALLAARRRLLEVAPNREVSVALRRANTLAGVMVENVHWILQDSPVTLTENVRAEHKSMLELN